MAEGLLNNPIRFLGGTNMGGQPSFMQSQPAFPVNTNLPQVKPEGLTMDERIQGLYDMVIGWMPEAMESARRMVHDVGLNLGVTSSEARPKMESNWGDALNVGLAMTSIPGGLKAYHGSPYKFSKFSTAKIGSGEGAQAFGAGLYFAENPKIAKWYQKNLTKDGIKISGLTPRQMESVALNANRGDINLAAVYLARHEGDVQRARFGLMDLWRTSPADRGDAEKALGLLKRWEEKGIIKKESGAFYEVKLKTSPDELLDWDSPFSKQPPAVQNAIRKGWKERGFDDSQIESMIERDVDGSSIYRTLSGVYGDDPRSLAKNGVKGIRYKDAPSRGKDIGTENYVMFRDEDIEILKMLGLLGATGAAAGSQNP